MENIFSGVGEISPEIISDIFGTRRIEPILTWAGNKRNLLAEINQLLPDSWDYSGRFYDLFAGSGAVSFGLGFDNCVMNDLNRDVILAYEVIRDHPRELIEEIKGLKVVEEEFYRIRDRYNDWRSPLPDIQRAALTIYLARTCSHQGYRVNSQGKFNQSFGDRKQSVLNVGCYVTDISIFLSQPGHELRSKDFEDCLWDVKCGDVVYADPPYDNSKDGYNAQRFGSDDLLRLARKCDELTEMGVCAVVSNYDTPLVRNHFPDDRYDIKVLEVNHGVRAKGDKAKNEVLIWNRVKVA